VALPKSSGTASGVSASGSGSDSGEYIEIVSCNIDINSDTLGGSGFDKTHRHLIDAIRQRDTDALIDAVESGTVIFEIHFTVYLRL
jgi:hypothetical protein